MSGAAVTVVVVGGGNAGLCAAIAAREAGARSVNLLEAAPAGRAGGNTAFTAGLMRVAFSNIEEILAIAPDLTGGELAQTDFGSYSSTDFLSDLGRVTDHHCYPDLAKVLVDESHPTLVWMHAHGVRFAPAYGRQAFEVQGRFKFWGGAVLEVVGGGPGLVESLTKAAIRAGVEIRYSSRALALEHDGRGICGVRVREDGGMHVVPAQAVVLASGGLEANSEWRTRYLGPGWALAKVRGTCYNVGDGIEMALRIGASVVGNWSGCHAVS